MHAIVHDVTRLHFLPVQAHTPGTQSDHPGESHPRIARGTSSPDLVPCAQPVMVTGLNRSVDCRSTDTDDLCRIRALPTCLRSSHPHWTILTVEAWLVGIGLMFHENQPVHLVQSVRTSGDASRSVERTNNNRVLHPNFRQVEVRDPRPPLCPDHFTVREHSGYGIIAANKRSRSVNSSGYGVNSAR